MFPENQQINNTEDSKTSDAAVQVQEEYTCTLGIKILGFKHLKESKLIESKEYEKIINDFINQMPVVLIPMTPQIVDMEELKKQIITNAHAQQNNQQKELS